MKNLVLACAVLSFSACGDNSSPPDLSGPDLSAPDLSVVPDLFMPDFKGVACGAQSCDPNSQVCCAMAGGGGITEQCTAPGACDADAGAALMCDGPEDCPNSSPPAGGCCVSLNGSTGGGGDGGMGVSGNGGSLCTASCVGTAVFDAANNSFTAHSKLCHAAADCTGYNGKVKAPPLVPNETSFKFDGCCSSPMVPGYKFCAPSVLAGMGGFVCN